jgi:hypothetical protein
VTVLFGGTDVFNSRVPVEPLGDTWTWDGSQWVQQHPAVRPPGRSAAIMVYDSARETTVLFGDTWS